MIDHYRLQGGDEATADSLVPFLGIAFVILIFFLVSISTIRSPGFGVAALAGDVPAEDRSGPGGSMPDAPPVLVRISSGGSIRVKDRPVEIGDVRRTLAEMIFERPAVSVSLVVDEGSRASLIARVVDQLKLAGVDDLRLSISQESTNDL